MASTPALEVEELTVRRGLLEVVHHASLVVGVGETRAILGLNGAGKTSLFLALAGAIPIEAGRIRVNGADVTGRSSWTCCQHRLVCVPAGRQLFGGLSVLDNLLVGSHLRDAKVHRRDNLQRVFEYFPVLATKQRQRADELSGGQQQMLAIGRGMMADPAVLLLDEPSEGLAPVVVNQVFAAVGQLVKEASIAVLLAEQNPSILDICDTAMMMRNGELSAARPADSTGAFDLEEFVFEAG